MIKLSDHSKVNHTIHLCSVRKHSVQANNQLRLVEGVKGVGPVRVVGKSFIHSFIENRIGTVVQDVGLLAKACIGRGARPTNLWCPIQHWVIAHSRRK